MRKSKGKMRENNQKALNAYMKLSKNLIFQKLFGHWINLLSIPCAGTRQDCCQMPIWQAEYKMQRDEAGGVRGGWEGKPVLSRNEKS